VTITAIEASPRGVQGFLEDLQESLRAKTYQPQATRYRTTSCKPVCGCGLRTARS